MLVTANGAFFCTRTALTTTSCNSCILSVSNEDSLGVRITGISVTISWLSVCGFSFKLKLTVTLSSITMVLVSGSHGPHEAVME